MKRNQQHYGITDVYAFAGAPKLGFEHQWDVQNCGKKTAADYCWLHFYDRFAAVPAILNKIYWKDMDANYCRLCDDKDLSRMLEEYGFKGCIKEVQGCERKYMVDRMVREWARPKELLKPRPWTTKQKKLSKAIKYLIAVSEDYDGTYFYNTWGFKPHLNDSL